MNSPDVLIRNVTSLYYKIAYLYNTASVHSLIKPDIEDCVSSERCRSQWSASSRHVTCLPTLTVEHWTPTSKASSSQIQTTSSRQKLVCFLYSFAMHLLINLYLHEKFVFSLLSFLLIISKTACCLSSHLIHTSCRKLSYKPVII